MARRGKKSTDNRRKKDESSLSKSTLVWGLDLRKNEKSLTPGQRAKTKRKRIQRRRGGELLTLLS